MFSYSAMQISARFFLSIGPTKQSGAVRSRACTWTLGHGWKASIRLIARGLRQPCGVWLRENAWTTSNAELFGRMARFRGLDCEPNLFVTLVVISIASWAVFMNSRNANRQKMN